MANESFRNLYRVGLKKCALQSIDHTFHSHSYTLSLSRIDSNISEVFHMMSIFRHTCISLWTRHFQRQRLLNETNSLNFAFSQLNKTQQQDKNYTHPKWIKICNEIRFAVAIQCTQITSLNDFVRTQISIRLTKQCFVQ